MNETIVDVAAAVILREDGREFLLARRPAGKVYEGYWEFPGGKVEPGEDSRQALVRELHEELGIRVTAATPWITRRFAYPHAEVRLHFWRVTDWEGELSALEHSALAWEKIGAPVQVAPILPANDPILKALSLPPAMAITNMSEHGEDAELTRLENGVANGLRLFQLRDKDLPAIERAWFAQAAHAMVKPSGALLLVNDDESLARRVKADGVHFSGRKLNRCWSRPDFLWVGASCHSVEDLERAAHLEFDYALLGPVLPTRTHPDEPPLGWEKFAEMVAGSQIPVFALGGMQLDLLEEARRHGAHGVALMRNW